MDNKIFQTLNGLIIEKNGQFIVSVAPKLMIDFDFIIAAKPYKRYHDAVAVYS